MEVSTKRKRKLSAAYARQKNAERSQRKRDADAEIEAPSMAQITMALGYAARAVLATERRRGNLVDQDNVIIPGPMNDLSNIALNRLRQSGYAMSGVTLSRFLRATCSDTPITPASRTAGITS